MKFINRISLWYPPLLASVLYGIYVISTNFNSPENFSWIALSKAIVQFYADLVFVGMVDDFLEKRSLPNRNLRLFLNFVMAWVISVVFGLILYVIMKQSFIIIYNQNDSIGFNHILITSLSITVGYVLIFSAYQVAKTSRQRLQSELKKAEYEKEKLRLHYELLYNKLEPHFLFNNLNTLHSLIVEKSGMAEEFVMSLSKVMRYSFQSQENEFVALEEELEVFDHYVSILKERFGDGLSYEITKTVDNQRRIVPMTLLNLLENVIKHNEISAKHPVRISVNILPNNLEVVNNINPKHVQMEGKDGLTTISQIHKIKTGENVTYSRDNGMFKVSIPYVVS
ncbi:MAG: histidine kinase [Bacteroidota bacterium]